jgi:transcriptional regulator with XRE-family HTH domain
MGEHLKRVRLDRSIRQKEVVRSLGCRLSTLGTWEKGRVAPGVRF